MNNVNEILFFINELDFTDRKKNDHIEKLRCVKQRLIIDFEDCNVSKIILALNVMDETNVLIMTNNLDSRLEKTNSLRECIFYLITFKQFAECAGEVVIEK